jgi:hypothetical protein
MVHNAFDSKCLIWNMKCIYLDTKLYMVGLEYRLRVCRANRAITYSRPDYIYRAEILIFLIYFACN